MTPATPMTTQEANKAAALELIERGFNQGDLTRRR